MSNSNKILNSFSSTPYGTFEGDNFSIGYSKINEYKPIYSIHEKFEFNREDDKFRINGYTKNGVIYKKHDIYSEKKFSTGTNNYSDFFDFFYNSIHCFKCNFKVNGETQNIYISYGTVYDTNGKCIILLTTKNYHISNIQNDNYSNYKLYISNELLFNPIYKNFYRKFQNEVIYKLMHLNVSVEIVHINYIEDKFFSEQIQIEYNNLDKLMHHLTYDVVDYLNKLNYSTELP